MTLTPEIVAEMERLHAIATEVDPTDWVGALAAAERLDVLRVEHTSALLAAYAEAERLRKANRLLADEVRAWRSHPGIHEMMVHAGPCWSNNYPRHFCGSHDCAVQKKRAAVDAAGLVKEGE